jgi:hypothetical protein
MSPLRPLFCTGSEGGTQEKSTGRNLHHFSHAADSRSCPCVEGSVRVRRRDLELTTPSRRYSSPPTIGSGA